MRHKSACDPGFATSTATLSDSTGTSLVCRFSAKMRLILAEEGFRLTGGDFQSMKIYRSDMFLSLVGYAALTAKSARASCR